MMMFAIVFGLSMDYEVFLLSRVREEYLRTGDSDAAVVDGIAKTARVITSAAPSARPAPDGAPPAGRRRRAAPPVAPV